MDKILYQKIVQHNRQEGEKEEVIVTEEVNRIIVWLLITEGEDEILMVLKHFPTYRRSEAIEEGVHVADERLKSRVKSKSSENCGSERIRLP